MIDPLADVVTLLQPGSPYVKMVAGAGRWEVRRVEFGRPFFCAVLEGACRLRTDGQAPLDLAAGDFVLVPAAQSFTMTGEGAPLPGDPAPEVVDVREGETRHGRPDGPADVRLLVGYCAFGSPDAALLVSLLPQLVHVRGEERLTALVRLVVDECRAARPARDVVLARLLEVLFIEALRTAAGTAAAPGLARGLADERLAAALRRMHADPARDRAASWASWATVQEAALSRSTFFERFSRAVGLAPMAYLLAWRMALAKSLLRRRAASVAEVAERVGYGSASAFSVAFARHAGMPPARYASAGATSRATLSMSTSGRGAGRGS